MKHSSRLILASLIGGALFLGVASNPAVALTTPQGESSEVVMEDSVPGETQVELQSSQVEELIEEVPSGEAPLSSEKDHATPPEIETEAAVEAKVEAQSTRSPEPENELEISEATIVKVVLEEEHQGETEEPHGDHDHGQEEISAELPDGTLMPLSVSAELQENLQTGDTVSFTVETGELSLDSNSTELDPSAVADEALAEGIQLEALDLKVNSSYSRVPALSRGEVHVVYYGTDPKITQSNLNSTVSGAFSYWNQESEAAIRSLKPTKTEFVTPPRSLDMCSHHAIENDYQIKNKYTVNDYVSSGAHLVIFFDPKNCPAGWAGMATVGNGISSGGVSWVKVPAGNLPGYHSSVLTHELGHNFGLSHSSARVCSSSTVDFNSSTRVSNRAAAKSGCYDSEYGDRYSVMGISMLGAAPAGLTVGQKIANGMISADYSAKVLPKSTGKSYTILAASTAPSTKGLRAVEIPIEATGERIFLEYRNNTGKDKDRVGSKGYTEKFVGSDGKTALRDWLPTEVRVVKVFADNSSTVIGERVGDRQRDYLAKGRSMKISGTDYTVRVDNITATQATLFVGPSTPAKPSPNSIGQGDLIVRNSAGTILNYGNLAKSPSKARTIGTGFKGFKSLTTADWNGDGVYDLIGNSGAKLYLYLGKKGGGFQAAKLIGSSGWANAELNAVKMKKGDRYPALIVRFPNGNLARYDNNNGSGLKKGVTIGSGWKGFKQVTFGYVDNDDKIDAIAKSANGKLLLYRTNGSKFLGGARPVVGSGWNSYTMATVGNTVSAGGTATVAKARGKLYHYTHKGGKLVSTKLIGNGGWDPMYLVNQSI